MVRPVLQDSSSSGDNVKRLDADSKAQMKEIEGSIESKKKEVPLWTGTMCYKLHAAWNLHAVSTANDSPSRSCCPTACQQCATCRCWTDCWATSLMSITQLALHTCKVDNHCELVGRFRVCRVSHRKCAMGRALPNLPFAMS